MASFPLLMHPETSILKAGHAIVRVQMRMQVFTVMSSVTLPFEFMDGDRRQDDSMILYLPDLHFLLCCLMQ